MGNNSTFNVTKNSFGRLGWTMILFFGVVFFLNTLTGNAWQVATGYWQTSYGWDTTTLMSMHSYGQIIALVSAFVILRLTIKGVSAKAFSVLLGALTVVCLLVCAFTSSFAVACVMIALIGLAVNNWTVAVIPIFVSGWFPRKKGLVMGWATIGVPAGAGLSAKILTACAEFAGISFGFIVLAIIAAVATVVALVFATDDPEKKGYHPDNDNSLTSEMVKKMQEEDDASQARSPWTIARVLKTREFWCLALPNGVLMFVAGGIMSTLFLYLTSLGYTAHSSGNHILTAAIIACPASYLMGWLDSKLGTKRAAQICFIVAMLACILFLTSTNVGVIIATAMLGATVGGASNFSASLVIEFWGPKNFKRVYSVYAVVFAIPATLAVLYCTQVAKFTGGYTAVFGGMVVFLVIGLIALSTVKKNFVEQKEASFR